MSPGTMGTQGKNEFLKNRILHDCAIKISNFQGNYFFFRFPFFLEKVQ
jgi:hypothetical protein